MVRAARDQLSEPQRPIRFPLPLREKRGALTLTLFHFPVVIPANASDPASYAETPKLDPDFRQGDEEK